LNSRRNTSASWRHLPFLTNLANLISSGIEPTTLSTSTLWWKGQQWLSQEPSSWPTTEMNTQTDNLEIRNMHIACLQPPEDITRIFSKLKRFIRVIGYCKRFIRNCRNTKANRQSTILSTQGIGQTLVCCVKIVQQISYAHEIRNLMEQQEVSASISLKKLPLFIDKEDVRRLGIRLQQSTLSYQTMIQMILPSNHQFT